MRAQVTHSAARREGRAGQAVRAWIGAIAVLSLAIPAMAGSPAYKCPETAQTCLDYMVNKFKGQGWLGIWMDDDGDHKVIKVTRVMPSSPAEAAGFKVGDQLISVNGTKFSKNTESKCVTCESMKKVWKPGKRIHYVVRRKGKNVSLRPTLAEVPADAMAQMIGMHMLEHARPVASLEPKAP